MNGIEFDGFGPEKILQVYNSFLPKDKNLGKIGDYA